MIRHECDANVFSDSLSVYFHERSEHWLHGHPWPPGGDLIIFYCPYCGEKLEPPDVKVEVSQRLLIDWLLDLDTAIAEGGIGEYGTLALLRIQRVAKSVRTYLPHD